MAYDDGQKWSTDAKDFMPGTEEFSAVAATPYEKQHIYVNRSHG